MFDIPSFCRTFKKDLDIFGGTLKKETGGRDQEIRRSGDQETEVRGQTLYVRELHGLLLSGQNTEMLDLSTSHR